MLAVGLNMAKVEAQALSDIQHIAEVQANGVEEHRGHADFIQCPDILSAARVIWLPPAELHPKLSCTWRELH